MSAAANAMEAAVKWQIVLTLRVALHVRVLLHTPEMDSTAMVSHIL